LSGYIRLGDIVVDKTNNVNTTTGVNNTSWDYGKTIDTMVGGLVAIKVMESGMNMIDRASNMGSKKKTKKRKSKSYKFHKFGDSLY